MGSSVIHLAEERTSEFENVSVETSQLQKQRGKNDKNCKTITKMPHTVGIPEGKRIQEIFGRIIDR